MTFSFIPSMLFCSQKVYTKILYKNFFIAVKLSNSLKLLIYQQKYNHSIGRKFSLKFMINRNTLDILYMRKINYKLSLLSVNVSALQQDHRSKFYVNLIEVK
jgi:hypothetical protein